MSESLLDKLDTWKKAMGEYMFKSLLIRTFEDIKIPEYTELLPPIGSELLLQVFKNVPIDDVKVVILGMDIYHDGSYIGRAFGNKQGKKMSPSLRNIIKEVQRTHNVTPAMDLEAWEKQGVLLVNVAHTVLRGKPGSHIEAWTPFTNTIIRLIDYYKNKEVVWLLMGKNAEEFKDLIKYGAVVVTGHPSPLNRSNPFVGSDAFIKIDEYLKERNLKIKWG